MEKRLASRRVPDELRKRTFASCDTCRKASGDLTLPGWLFSSQNYANHNVLAPLQMIHCLEAIVKGAFPGEPVDSISALLELGRKAGYEMPKLDLPQQNENEQRVELRSSESAYQTLTCASTSNDQAGCIKTSQRPPQLVKDSRGHSHYNGPSASLAFFADLRSLVSEQQPSSCFAADTLTESLEARQDSSRLSPTAVSTDMTPLARDEE
ncbi:hypothetical protein AnigIFM63604_011295 [Aspergillus niger]|uniref:Uncharacterized protein n=1 Tax=Aspergillus niger TaxID=5061 RepID=A0A9W5ZWI1_ASPNG|nr:hypothetical protein AnigIFM63604_011295 [Aspergillus niger]